MFQRGAVPAVSSSEVVLQKRSFLLYPQDTNCDKDKSKCSTKLSCNILYIQLVSGNIFFLFIVFLLTCSLLSIAFLRHKQWKHEYLVSEQLFALGGCHQSVSWVKKYHRSENMNVSRILIKQIKLKSPCKLHDWPLSFQPLKQWSLPLDYQVTGIFPSSLVAHTDQYHTARQQFYIMSNENRCFVTYELKMVNKRTLCDFSATVP